MKVKRLLAILMSALLLLSLTALPASAATDGYASQVLSLVNQERAKKDLPALQATIVNLNSAAQKRATELPLRSKLEHYRPDGRSWSTIFDEYDVGSWTARGENIAEGYTTPAAVMSAWMNSKGHKANILGPYTHIGIGVYETGGSIYWCQLFINDGSYVVEDDSSSISLSLSASLSAVLNFILRYFFFGWLWM